MSSGAELEVLYNISNARVMEFPFPHIFVRDVFPADYYRRILEHLPPDGSLQNLKALGRVTQSHPDTRMVMPLTQENLALLDDPRRAFWENLARWLVSSVFGQVMISKFAPYLQHRFGDLGKQRFFDEALVVRDYSTYALRPHSDLPQKVLAFLFYLPADASRSHLGTSIYLPKNRDFTCAGGPHYPFDQFERVLTMPYVPNAMFAFMKTLNSFHGVEPIKDENVRRDLLLYDIKIPAAEVQPAPAAAPTTRFTM